MNGRKKRIAILGSGSWGTALAVLLDGAGHRVRLWGAFPEEIDAIRRAGANERYLPGIEVAPSIEPTADLDAALDGAELAVLAVPSHVMGELCGRLAGRIPPETVLVSVAKGIEIDGLRRMSTVIRDLLGPVRLAVLSGPSHAEEVARRIPTAVVAASDDPDVARDVQETFMTDRFRVYTSDDVAGVEYGGSLKNVFAIASGVSDGIGFGDNTKAALITRGLAELSRLGVALGGRRETFSGLSGMGDLIVTCLSRWSRNRRVGERLGRGEKLDAILADMTMVAEGVRTTRAARMLARRAGVEAPIIEKVYQVLYEDHRPDEAVALLMTRSAKPEFDSDDS